MNTKKKLNLIMTLLLIGHFAGAQQWGPVFYYVSYEAVHVNDTNHRDSPLVETLQLQVAQNASKYWRAPVVPQPVTTTEAPRVVSVTVVGKPMAVVNAVGITESELFVLPGEGKINLFASLGSRQYVIEQKLTPINWQVGSETRMIGGYNCQNAHGTFAGRQYTAWFTTELPFQSGPWKLWGLPGLILEATDARNEVKFLFKDIVKDSIAEPLKTLRREPVKVSEQAYLRAKEAFEENPVAVMQSQLPAGSPTPTLAYRDASGKFVKGDDAAAAIEKKKQQEKNNNNNPLELSKK